MSDFVTAFTTDVTAVELWAVLTGLVSIITLFFLFSIGVRALNRVLKKGSKGKAGI